MTTVAEVDFIKRLADGWDGRGDDVLTFAERRALWALCGFPPMPVGELHPHWQQLSPRERESLVRAARQTIELARWAQRCFGER
ncbi:MAG: hypothetical protein M3Y79_09265 [Pseudomonadota bacterium]|nr:hypothetical protein [Pseudomonadota bacterium]